MEFCIAQPITDYDIETGVGRFEGIYTTYFSTPDKFALILLCTVLPFAYEPTATITTDLIAKTIGHDLDAVLNFELQPTHGRPLTISEVFVHAKSVEEQVASLIEATNAHENPIIKMLYSGNLKSYQQIVMARYFAYVKYQALLTRGAIKSKHKNILSVNFEAKGLSDVQEKFLSDAIRELNIFFADQKEN